MIVACLALAVALGGTGYAAIKLPKNSVGSKQVKPNSLKGIDVLESSFKGVVLGKGTLSTGAKGLPGGSDFATLMTIPGIGRIEVDCAPGGVASNHRIVNTTGAYALTWRNNELSAGTTFEAIPAGMTGGPASTGVDSGRLTTWFIETAVPKERLTIVHVATLVSSGNPCLNWATAERITRP
jgi:hypothetical protein